MSPTHSLRLAANDAQLSSLLSSQWCKGCNMNKFGFKVDNFLVMMGKIVDEADTRVDDKGNLCSPPRARPHIGPRNDEYLRQWAEQRMSSKENLTSGQRKAGNMTAGNLYSLARERYAGNGHYFDVSGHVVSSASPTSTVSTLLVSTIGTEGAKYYRMRKNTCLASETILWSEQHRMWAGRCGDAKDDKPTRIKALKKLLTECEAATVVASVSVRWTAL